MNSHCDEASATGQWRWPSEVRPGQPNLTGLSMSGAPIPAAALSQWRKLTNPAQSRVGISAAALAAWEAGGAAATGSAAPGPHSALPVPEDAAIRGSL